MRIAIDANVLDGKWGGIPKYLHRIASEQVHLVKGRSLWREAFLPLWLARHRCDVLWAPESVLPRFSPVPTAVTIHDLASLRFPGIKSEEHVRSVRGEVARSARRATRVISVSQTTADDLEEQFGIGAETVRVVPNGVDDAFAPGDREAAVRTVRDRWGIDGPFVLHVGALEPRKGLDVLIEAAALAAAEGAAWRVVLAGMPGFDGERIEAAARASGACDPIGRVTDAELLELLRAAEAFAAPALYEGFGIAPLEAMACGTPAVVAAESGGLEEISGPAAIVVAERTPRAWREALEEAIQRPPELIDRGLRHAARYRWPAVATETRDVLAEAAQIR